MYKIYYLQILLYLVCCLIGSSKLLRNLLCCMLIFGLCLLHFDILLLLKSYQITKKMQLENLWKLVFFFKFSRSGLFFSSPIWTQMANWHLNFKLYVSTSTQTALIADCTFVWYLLKSFTILIFTIF